MVEIDELGNLVARPRIFIGSASESMHVAVALQVHLEKTSAVTLWPDVFNLGEYTLDDLLQAADENDFAAFVFTPDDDVSSRGENTGITRDNVIFEFGLFTATLGRRRAFVVRPRGTDVKILTDLYGVSVALYSPPKALGVDPQWNTALAPAAARIQWRMTKAPPRRNIADASQAASITRMQAPVEALVAQLLADARRSKLATVSDPASAGVVVHRRLGLGTIVGWDPPGGSERMVQVRFEGHSGVGTIPMEELFQLR